MPNLKNTDILKNGFFTHTEPIRSFFAPGRINLIGEHLDYNGGFVFPAAISLGITGFIQERSDSIVMMKSDEAPGIVTADCDGNIIPGETPEWGAYPLGVIKCLKEKGMAMARGAAMLFSSTLPQGSGLSSSAALEVLTAYMVLGGAVTSDAERVRLALLMRDMENDYIGVQCGIMDQFTVALGKKGNAILLNTGTMEFSHVPVDTGDSSFVIMNSNRPRALAHSKYNERRSQCEQALAMIREYRPSVTCLAQAAAEDLLLVKDRVLRKRARHVITENTRVLESVEALRSDDLPRFGHLLTESNQSLRHDFEVTGHELDVLVDAAMNAPGCAGARMTGAGFGGCAIALVENELIEEFKKEVGTAYRGDTGLNADFYISILEDGVRETNPGIPQ